MTSIEWTRGDDGAEGATWNPTTGCDKISPGCGLPRFEGDATGGCYAMTMAKRLKAMGQAKYQRDGDPRTSGPGFGLTVHPDTLDLPLKWRKPRHVFVNSMSDLFHARVPVGFIAQVWVTMARTPRHTYQILTKRPERMRAIVGEGIDGGHRLLGELDSEEDAQVFYSTPFPLPNVHLGTSIELDHYARRADELRQTDAAIRFLSLEPLLGPLPSLDLSSIDWMILGGESGAASRRMDLAWVRDLIAQGRESGTAIFVKQLGSVLGRQLGAGDKGGDWDAWPEDLRLREFPRAPEAMPA